MGKKHNYFFIKSPFKDASDVLTVKWLTKLVDVFLMMKAVIWLFEASLCFLLLDCIMLSSVADTLRLKVYPVESFQRMLMLICMEKVKKISTLTSWRRNNHILITARGAFNKPVNSSNYDWMNITNYWNNLFLIPCTVWASESFFSHQCYCVNVIFSWHGWLWAQGDLSQSRITVTAAFKPSLPKWTRCSTNGTNI